MIRLGAVFALVLAQGAVAQTWPEAGRVVSVGGSVTEIVYALGEQHRLVARDTTSAFPPEVTGLPDVGYMRALSPEGLLAVGPDLILAEEGAGPPETIAQLQAAAVPFVTIPDDWSDAGVIAKIYAVGKALGVPRKAETLAAQVQADLAGAARFVAAQSGPKPRVLFILTTQGGRILASGSGTQADGMIRLAGGENVITDFEGYKPLTDEAVIAAAPDVVLVMDRGGDHIITAESLFAFPAMALTPAAKQGWLIRMDGLYLMGFGPRTGAAVRDLAAALHPAPQ